VLRCPTTFPYNRAQRPSDREGPLACCRAAPGLTSRPWRRGAAVSASAGARRAVVTGAARGIGLAVARRLRREGTSVLAVDINERGLVDAAEFGCEVMAADLADPAERDRLAAASEGIDYLVNAAGIILLKSIFDVSPEEWRRVFAVNAEPIFFLCQAIGPRMREGGAIVNLSSSSAKLASTTEAAVYAASKTTILSITRSFA